MMNVLEAFKQYFSPCISGKKYSSSGMPLGDAVFVLRQILWVFHSRANLSISCCTRCMKQKRAHSLYGEKKMDDYSCCLYKW